MGDNRTDVLNVLAGSVSGDISARGFYRQTVRIDITPNFAIEDILRRNIVGVIDRVKELFFISHDLPPMYVVAVIATDP